MLDRTKTYINGVKIFRRLYRKDCLLLIERLGQIYVPVEENRRFKTVGIAILAIKSALIFCLKDGCVLNSLQQQLCAANKTIP